MRVLDLAIVFGMIGEATLPGAAPPAPPIDSPRIAALQRAVQTGDKTAVDTFCREVKGKAPIVEAIPGTDAEVWATYLWMGNKDTERVAVVGGVPIAVMKELARLPGTDLWYWTERTPRTGRFGYGFLVNPRRGSLARVQNDPLAARTYAEQSIAEMPGAPAQPWSDRKKGVPEGKRERFIVKSAVLKQDRRVTVYTPAGYDPKAGEYDLLIVFDGEASGGDVVGDNPIPGHVILDNLTAARKIAPVVAVFVESGETRDHDLGCDPTFAAFAAEELVTWVRGRYQVTKDSRRVTVSGFSRSGLGAAYCAFKHPEVIGNVIAMSGAFWWYPEADEDARKKPPVRVIDRETGRLTRQIAASKPVPVRFYLEAGRFEVGLGGGIRTETRRLRDVLEAKGCSVIYREPVGDHDYAVWRGSFADAILALTDKK
jgi:enterochelin esterase family protein